MDKLKTIIKIIAVILLIILINIFSKTYIINKNKNYEESIEAIIKDNYQVNSKITYINIYGNYYIFTTKDNIIVLNKEFEEVLTEKLSALAPNTNNYEIIYRTSKLMYENTIIKNNSITYEYYDAKTYEKIKTTTLEK